MATATATKKTTKGTKAAKVEKKVATPRAKKEGLRKPQVRILAYLNKQATPKTRKEISEKAPVDAACCVEYIGSSDVETRKKNDERKFPSLLTLGHVKLGQPAEEGGADVYSITPAGKKALAAAEKE